MDRRSRIADDSRRALGQWGRQRGVLFPTLPPEFTPSSPNDRGRIEHHVFRHGERWVKITKKTGNPFGLYPVQTGPDTWEMRPNYATAGGYLVRLESANDFAKDGIVLHGVLLNPDGQLQIITSQSHYHGTFSEPEAIREVMREGGFKNLGTHNGYYRARDNLAVLDMHGLNVIRQGPILQPFDVAVLRPAGHLRTLFENTREPQNSDEDSIYSAPVQANPNTLRAALAGMPRLWADVLQASCAAMQSPQSPSATRSANSPLAICCAPPRAA